MAGELEAVVKQVFAALDGGDADAALALQDDDVQGIDEISRRWMRGADDVGNYVRQLMGMVSGVTSELGDVRETVFGDAGLLTGWLEQDYTLEGQQQHISAPTSVVLRRAGGEWKILLFHSIPLPEAS